MDRRHALRLLGLSAVAPAVGRLGSSGLWSVRAQTAPPDVELLLTAAPDEVALLPGAATRVWRFSGRVLSGPAEALEPQPASSYLGPTLHLRRGQRVRVRFENRLDEPSIVHWHGLDVPQEADGHPRLVVGPGEDYVYDYTVTNRAGTYWYHPHPHMRTGPQVYMGMAGLLVVHDDEEDALELPVAQAELSCVIQDRAFDDQNQLVYPLMDQAGGGGMGRGRGMGRGMGMGRGRGMGRGAQGMDMAAMMAMEMGVLGDRVLVNGQPDFAADVESGWVRLRLFNGSNARVYKLAWSDDRPMTAIGVDGGLLERPIERTAVTLAPAQRADVLVSLSDLSDGDALRLVSLDYPTGDAGHMDMMMMGGQTAPPLGTRMDIMTLRIRGQNTRAIRLPDRLSAFRDDWAERDDAPVRRIALSFAMMQWMIDGRVFEMTQVTDSETVQAGSTHVWEFQNTTNPMGMEMAHPIHLHGRQFRVLGRSGGTADNALRAGLVDSGWTDTVLVLPGETVRTQVTFSEHRGLFLYHCHLLEHEDMGMMRNFRIV